MTDGAEFSHKNPQAFEFVRPLESGLEKLLGQKADEWRARYHEGVIAYLDIPDATDMGVYQRAIGGFFEGLSDFDDQIGLGPGGAALALGGEITHSVKSAREAGMSDDEIRQLSLQRLAEDEAHQEEARQRNERVVAEIRERLGIAINTSNLKAATSRLGIVSRALGKAGLKK